MAHYYCRQDGTAATIGAATGVNGKVVGSTAAAADASKCAPLTMISGNPVFAEAGSTVWLSSQGGEFTTVLADTWRATGANTTYRAVTGETPVFSHASGIVMGNAQNGLTLDGLTTSAGPIVFSGGGSGHSVKNCTIVNTADNGEGLSVTTSVSDGLTVSNTSITSSGRAIYVASGKATNLTLNRVTVVSHKSGVRIDKIVNLSIFDLRVLSAASDGSQPQVLLNGPTGTLTWRGGLLNAPASSKKSLVITTYSGTNPSFTNGLIHDVVSIGGGFQIDYTPNTSSLTLSRCRAIAPTGVGFYLGVQGQETHNITLVQCESWYSTGDDGFNHHGTTTGMKVYGCVAAYNGVKSATASGDGFSTHTGSSGVVYEGCTSVGNLFSGFHNNGASGGTIRNCHVSMNGDSYGTPSTEGGIQLSCVGGAGWTVENSICSVNYPTEWNDNGTDTIITRSNVVNPMVTGQCAKIGDDYHTLSAWKAHKGDTTSIEAVPGVDAMGVPSAGGNCWYGTGLPGLRTVGQIGSGITPSIELIGPGTVEAPLMRRKC